MSAKNTRRNFLKTSSKILAATAALSLSSELLAESSGKNAKNLAKNQTPQKSSTQDKPTAKPAKEESTSHYIVLNNGVKMPLIGYGTYQIEEKDAQKCVEEAIEVGYKSIDTAAAYFNEAAIGAALKNAIKGGIKRESLFITTKLWINDATESKATKAFETSLKKLGLEYIDLYLIHQPYNDTYGAWRAMSKLYKEGRIKAIGVSNFYPDRLLDFCLNNEIKPAVNQVECHPFFAKFDEQAQMQKLGVAMQSWASFGEGRNSIFTNPTLDKIAKKHNKTIAQVVLRWLLQRGIITIPKTSKKERMIENISIFDFSLSDQDLALIATLDNKKTLFLNHQDPKSVEFLINIHKGKF